MPTRYLVAGMQLFGIAAGVAIAVALLAPIDAVRFLGVVALACSGLGFLLHLHALQRFDPQAFMALNSRFRAAMNAVRIGASRTTASVLQSASSRSGR